MTSQNRDSGEDMQNNDLSSFCPNHLYINSSDFVFFLSSRALFVVMFLPNDICSDLQNSRVIIALSTIKTNELMTSIMMSGKVLHYGVFLVADPATIFQWYIQLPFYLTSVPSDRVEFISVKKNISTSLSSFAFDCFLPHWLGFVHELYQTLTVKEISLLHDVEYIRLSRR